jgi:elongation factor 1-alpha
MDLESILANGERGNIEFKEFLSEKIHLAEDRKQSLACQMNHRLLSGNGTALYVIGISDDGRIRGITKRMFDETVSVLSMVAMEVGARVIHTEEHMVDGNHVGLVTIKLIPLEKEHILIGTAGHVDHGKSTLLGSLISHRPDDGAGKTKVYFDVLPHEIERGLSAELSYGVFGFLDGKPIYLKNPLSKKERAWTVEHAEKIVSFVDMVGHEPWLRTTIRGIVGQKLDYGLLVVAADGGITHITKEHLGILLAMDLPTIIVITKADKVDEKKLEKVESQISDLIGLIGKTQKFIRSKNDISTLSKNLKNVIITLRTSALTLEGFELLEELLKFLPKRNFESRKPFQLYIDKIYQIAGVGTVVSGTVKQGIVSAGDDLLIGPLDDNSFKKVRAHSIEMHYHRVKSAGPGDVIGIAVKGIKNQQIRRGMILCSTDGNPEARRRFDAEVLILNHPTRIKQGYEPVVHLETICEAVSFKKLERDYMMAGQKGKVTLEFKFHPYCIYQGQKFVFREGHSKGIGRVL